MFTDVTVVDLSIGIEDGAASESDPASLDRMDHQEGTAWPEETGGNWALPVAVFEEVAR